MKRGSVLIMALWIIAVLAVMVMSFAFEAHQQAGINVYVRERNRVNRLIEPGRILGEIVMLGFKDAKEPELRGGAPDWKDIFEEEDRWCKEKYELKTATRCTIGPILLDEEDPDSGTVTVDIELANSGSENGINVNELYAGGDQSYAMRWQMILRNAGIPEELEVEAPESDGRTTKKHNLMNLLIASWNDWRDDDDAVTRGPLSDSDYNPQDDDGAESAWYEEWDEQMEKDAHGEKERNAAKEERRLPRNGSIPDIKELGYIRGFRDFPSVLTGGYLYDGVQDKEIAERYESVKGTEENPMLKGIVNIFGTSGSSKIVLNPQTTIDQLMTIPGIFQDTGNEDDDREDSQELAQAILDALKVMPEDYDVDETRDWWPYKDWQDLNARVEDFYNGNVKLGNEAQEYIEWQPTETSVFKMKITGESMGMKREVNCKCYVKDKKVRYMEWRED